MQRWFLLHVNRLMPVVLLALSSTAYVGCEPPPVAEKKQEPKPTAQAKASQPQFAPRATPKPTPAPKPSATVVVVAPPPPPPPPKRLEFKEVALSNGRKVTRDMFQLNRGRIVQMFPTTNTSYFLDADPKDDLLRGVFGFSSDGKRLLSSGAKEQASSGGTRPPASWNTGPSFAKVSTKD